MKVIHVDSNRPNLGKLREAAKVLRNGGLVAFPTETVYGLGANAYDAFAVGKIFKAKGRPADNPLIVHVVSLEQVQDIVKIIPLKARKLMERFWPGPLTIVLKRGKKIPDIVSAGLDSVAVRMPSHPIARILIKEAGVPIAAPSANVSGRPSPTSAKHVIDDLNGLVDVIIDGGECEVGLESSVVDLTGKKIRLLRPGGVSLEEIEKVVGKILVGGKKVRSPGMKYRHYAPNARVLVVDKDKIGENIKKFSKNKVGVFALKSFGVDREVVARSLDDMAKRLFEVFRKFDDEGIEVIIVEKIEERGIGRAIMNRLRKAGELKE